jgi:hypothetical protein
MKAQTLEAVVGTIVIEVVAGALLRGCVACERAGGVYVRGWGGGVCLDPKAVRK